MNPVDKIVADRVSARGFNDPIADVCFLALSDDNRPSVRTLVMRNISEAGFTLFVNKTSEKWRILEANNRAELLLWFSTLQRQYRVRGIIEELDRESIENNWPRRPTGSKYLDHAYSHFQRQSSSIESHATLARYIQDFKQDNPEKSLTTPATATGLKLIPGEIEMLDLNDPNRIHDRRLFRRDHDNWVATQLMP